MNVPYQNVEQHPQASETFRKKEVVSSLSQEVRYLVFDIESVADSALIASIRHPQGDVSPEEALATYRKELMEKKGTDFIPYTYQVPISLALAKVGADFSLIDLKVLQVEEGGPKAICEKFWKGWQLYKKPIFVTFNGRGFDFPLMELMAFRYGIPIPDWFALGGKAYEQPRNRYHTGNHLDLCDFLSNYGAVQFSGGLNIAAQILHKPGKVETKGEMVQDMYDAGQLAQIHDYCRCDVLDTYFVFLRTMLLSGRMGADQKEAKDREEKIHAETHRFLEQNVSKHSIYQDYLNAWDEKEKTPDFPIPFKEGLEN